MDTKLKANTNNAMVNRKIRILCSVVAAFGDTKRSETDLNDANQSTLVLFIVQYSLPPGLTILC